MEDSPCFYEGQGSDCSPLRPQAPRRVPTAGQVLHTFVERMTQKEKRQERDCCTQTLALDTLGWRQLRAMEETGLNVINGLIRAELCVAQ